MCDPKSPCGGMLIPFPDNARLAAGGVPQQAIQCLNGHMQWLALPAPGATTALALGVCKTHAQPRPCPVCIATFRACRLETIRRHQAERCASCGGPIQEARLRYCSKRCSEAAYREQNAAYKRARRRGQQLGARA